MTLSMLIAYCSKPYQVTDPEYTKKSHLRIVFGEKMYEIERVTLIEIIIFTLTDSCHSLAKETAENTDSQC